MCGDQSGLFLVFEPIAFALDVGHGGVVQQVVEDGRGDDIVGEDGAPLAVALVRGQDDRALLIPFAHELEQACGGEGFQRQIACLVEHQQLGLDQQGHSLSACSRREPAGSVPRGPAR